MWHFDLQWEWLGIGLQVGSASAVPIVYKIGSNAEISGKCLMPAINRAVSRRRATPAPAVPVTATVCAVSAYRTFSRPAPETLARFRPISGRRPAEHRLA